MIELQPTCRDRFTQADFDFLSRTLEADATQRESLDRLFHDPEALDLLLDQEGLFHALLEERGFLGVSSYFYFYILVRQVLMQAGCDDRELADYVGALLAQFSSARRVRRPVKGLDGAVDYLVDILQAMQEADETTRFMLTLHLGNYALYLAGLFPDYIKQRARRCAAPGLAYYEALGSSHFNVAGNHRLAIKYQLAPVLGTLAKQFTTTRLALNDLSERLVLWGDIALP